MAATDGAPHVPAWKRLGLKLKFAKDTPEPSPLIQQQQTSHSTPPQQDSLDYQRASKRRKTVSTASRTALPTIQPDPADIPSEAGARTPGDTSTGTPVRASVESEAAPRTKLDFRRYRPNYSNEGDSGIDISHLPEGVASGQTKTPKRRKSVTFTEETKATDGNSAQSFPDPTLDNATPESPVSAPGPSATDKSPTIKPKKFKKDSPRQDRQSSSKKSSKKAPQIDAEPHEKPEYVRYLEQYHQDRASWKFNKNHQTALLKHALDLNSVPPSLTPALVEYISGLQGAGPRQRLIENAIAILETFAAKDESLDEIKAMNTQSARKEAYFRAMAKQIKKWEDAGMPESEYDNDQLAKINEEIARGKRGEAIIEILGMGATLEEANAAVNAVADPSTSRPTSPDDSNSTLDASQPKKTARKRKRRGEVDSDSSSSDSDSDSDSSSSDDSSDDNTQPHPSAKMAQPSNTTKPPPSRTPAYQHDNFNMAYRPQNPSQLINANVKPTKKFFDDDLLDAAFPKKKTYNDVAPKRRKEGKKEEKKRARGFAYTHGTKADESGSEDE